MKDMAMINLKFATALTTTVFLSGVAEAVKPLGYCSGLQESAVKSASLGYEFRQLAKYCDKGPDSELAAKLAEKLAKRRDSVCERYNAKLANADCATFADPDLATAMPMTCGADPLALQAVIQSWDGACDGVATQ